MVICIFTIRITVLVICFFNTLFEYPITVKAANNNQQGLFGGCLIYFRIDHKKGFQI